MTIYLIRIFLYTLLPLIVAGTVSWLDPLVDTRQKRIEVFLIYLFGLGVAGSGIGNAAGHLFLSDIVAESIGWETGSPFQLEMGFANLAMGVLGLIAVGRRDAFRDATVVAVTVLSVGATIVHVIDIVKTGNLAPGNTWQNVVNLSKPALLIGFLVASRRGDTDDEVPDPVRGPHMGGAGWMTGLAATGFATGYAMGRPLLGTGLGVLAGAIAAAAQVIASRRSQGTSGRT